ncbi:MAG: HvfC/BufC family peptide modification chaperone [Thiobacillus sp.]
MKSFALTDLQVAFHDHLLNLSSDIAREVSEGGRIGADHRLHIYHNAYRVRLLENLQDAYEKTWAYLGDETFESSALAFIEGNPPKHRNLRWHGAELPQWLAVRFPQDRDIAELALIDWQLRLAFDGPDASPVQTVELAGLAAEDWASVGFQFVPTLFIVPVRFNSVAIWHALDQEQAPPAAEALPAPAWLLIWRKGWQPHFRTIQAAEYAALMQLQGGASFAQVCADLGEQFSDQEAANVAAESLRTWLQDEMIVGLTSTSA